jgi:YVTN family beta-propeller protein
MVFLVLFGIAMSGVIVVILSHNAFAQSGETLNDRRLSEVVNQASSSQQSSQIDVGEAPSAIGVSEEMNTVYVAKPDSNIVSVISGEDNTRIKDIEVGDNPVEIAVNDDTEMV